MKFSVLWWQKIPLISQSGCDRRQILLVQGYALDFKNFHEVSRDLVIAPVLIANEAPDSSATQEFCLYDN